jgi:hypothetical protein
MGGAGARTVTGLARAAKLVHSATTGFPPLGDALERLARAKQLLGEVGAADDTPTGVARELLAARDDLGALLLSAYILDEVGVAEAAIRDVLYRGSDRCYRRLRTLAHRGTLQPMVGSVS